ncbi:hypothetical protein BGZ47_011870 [Haplosporangium gracile]|nr:hypothetical protein BGZ47_011870 [Haplosporangium gracile]
MTTDRDMDTLIARESARIVKSAEEYGPNRVTILLMIQPGHLSCLQTLENSLLEIMSALDPTPTVPAPCWFTSRGATFTATSANNLVPVSVWGIPNVIACHSPQDTTDYLSKLLVPPPASTPRVLPHDQIAQEDYATRLEQGLSTVQNAVLATPVQLQNTCLLNQSTSKAIHDFFNTDQPI